MPSRDSVDKVIDSYIAVVSNEEFTYKNKVYEPKDLIVSPGLIRGFTCPAQCGACCPRFSLDYLPEDETPYELTERTVAFNGREIKIKSDMQKDHTDHHCRNLNKDNGRCGIHGVHPFTCDFELIRFAVFKEKPNRMTTRLYGRGWQMLRIDDDRGALCEITPPTEETVNDTVRKLKLLKKWCEHFGIYKNKVDALIAFCKSNPTQQKLIEVQHD